MILGMEKQIKKLMEFYQLNMVDLAKKVGISTKQLYNARNDVHVSWLLRKHIIEMVQKIESL